MCHENSDSLRAELSSIARCIVLRNLYSPTTAAVLALAGDKRGAADGTLSPTGTAAAIRNSSPGIHQPFQDSPGSKGLTGQIPGHKMISGTSAARRTSVPKRTTLHQPLFSAGTTAEIILVTPLQSALIDHRSGTKLIPDINCTSIQTHHPSLHAAYKAEQSSAFHVQADTWLLRQRSHNRFTNSLISDSIMLFGQKTAYIFYLVQAGQAT